ncbi:MAG: hypothetical protein VXA12_11625, partial [Gammaproteobacteria bacterium]
MVSVESLEGLVIVAYLPNKTLAEVVRASVEVARQLEAMSAEGRPVRRQFFDAERVCSGTDYRTQLHSHGIQCVSRDPGYHERTAERNIQTIQKMVSYIKAAVRWDVGKIPRVFHLLWDHCAKALAHIPREGNHGVTAHLAVTGAGRTWHSVSKIEFGAVVWAKRTQPELRLAKRNEGPTPVHGEPGLILGFADYCGTGRYFYKFGNGQIVVRREFDRMSTLGGARSMPQELLLATATPGFHLAYGESRERDMARDIKWGERGVKYYRQLHPGTVVTHKPSSLWKRRGGVPEAGAAEDSLDSVAGSSPASGVVSVAQDEESERETSLDAYLDVRELDVGDDVMVSYRGGDNRYPARVLKSDPEASNMDVIFFEGRTQMHVPFQWVSSVTPVSRPKYSRRQRSGRLVKEELWKLLGENLGSANETWARHSDQMNARDRELDSEDTNEIALAIYDDGVAACESRSGDTEVLPGSVKGSSPLVDLKDESLPTAASRLTIDEGPEFSTLGELNAAVRRAPTWVDPEGETHS